MRKSFGSLFCLLLIVALAAPLTGVAAAPATPQTPARASAKQTAALKQSATGLYIVELDDQPLASYDGGVQGLRATSLSATGGAQLDTDSVPSRAYRNYLAGKRQSVLRAAEQVLGSRPQVAQTYDVVYNGMALKLSLAQAQKLQSVPGVKQVIPDFLRQVQTDAGPAWIGAAQPGEAHAPALFKATINGAQEVPPNSSTATGAGVFTYDAASKTLMYRISYSGLSGPATAAHIHTGAAGVNGPIRFPLSTATPGAIIGTATLVITDEQQLYAQGLYVNIHTADNPGGEIRGQIVPNQGEGMLVGIIDTGINFAHKSFAPTGADGYTVQNPLGAGNYKGACDTTAPPASEENPSGYNPAIICNSKLIGAWTFAATAESPSPIGEPSPADDDEHGSHTASTAAGNIVTSTILLPSGVVTDTGTIGGVAPHANVIAYDTCNTTSGCPTSALVAAIDQATKDKVNVINYSIGGGSRDPFGSPDSFAFLLAFNAGIVASVSAGNDGPDPETIGSPSNAPWVMSVAASTHNRVYRNSLTDYSGGGTPPPTLVGKGFTGGTGGALPVVYAGAAPYNNALCEPFADGTDLSGLIVVCDRGEIGRVAKAQNVADAGGAGYVLANDEANGDSLVGDLFPIPGVHISYDDGVLLKAWLASGTGHQARITGAFKDASPANGDIMAGFSSRGPDLTAFDILKPDVAAPGVDILAAYANTDPDQDEFGFLSGTSMAAPHNAGAMTLVRQLHPDWTPNEIFSAMMTTSITATVLNDDGTPAGSFDRGAGRIDVSNAAMAGLVLNETAQNYASSDPLEDGVPRDLNRASMLDSACVVTCVWTRTFRSTLPVTATWNATTAAVTSSLGLTVEPASFIVAPGASQTITVTADVSTLPLDEYAFSELVLTDADGYAPVAHLPIVARPATSNLQDALQITSDETNASTTIEGVRAIAISDLDVQVYGLAKATFTRASADQDSDNNDVFDDLSDGTAISSIDVPTGTARFVTEVITTTSEDLDMYVALDGSGETPADGIVQDDELVCVSATGSALEVCDFVFPPAGRYIIVVQNWKASEAGVDTLTLSNGVVPAADAGNLSVTAPQSQPAGQPFNLAVGWNVPRTPGDRWYGAFELGTAPADAGNLGYTTVDLISTTTPRITYLPIIGK